MAATMVAAMLGLLLHSPDAAHATYLCHLTSLHSLETLYKQR